MTRIEKFKASKFGQIALAFLAGVALTASVYEHIRIPALSSQISLKDVQIQGLEARKTSVDKTSNSPFTPSVIGKEITQSSSEKHSAKETKVGFEQAVNLLSDQEDAAFSEIDKDVSEVKIFSLASFQQSMNAAQTEALKTHDMVEFANKMVVVQSDFYSFLLNLEKTRAFCTKSIISHYRQILLKFDDSQPEKFLSEIRLKPELLIRFTQLSEKLRSYDSSSSWQTNAVSILVQFVNSTTNSVSPVPDK